MRNVWTVSGDMIPLNPKMDRVPVLLQPYQGNPGQPTTTTISKQIYSFAQRCSQRLYFDGEKALALKVENGTLMIGID